MKTFYLITAKEFNKIKKGEKIKLSTYESIIHRINIEDFYNTNKEFCLKITNNTKYIELID